MQYSIFFFIASLFFAMAVAEECIPGASTCKDAYGWNACDITGRWVFAGTCGDGLLCRQAGAAITCENAIPNGVFPVQPVRIKGREVVATGLAAAPVMM